MSNPKHELLTPANCTLILIDHQPQMTFGVASIDRQLLKNNVVGLAKAASVINVPTVLTAVETESFSGYLWPEIVDVFPGHKPTMPRSGSSMTIPVPTASVLSMPRPWCTRCRSRQSHPTSSPNSPMKQKES